MTSPSDLNGNPAELLLVVRAKEANRFSLRSRPNVVGLDVGFRTRQGVMTGERVVKVYVSRKVDPSFLNDEMTIPSSLRLEGREIGVDVEQRAVPQAIGNFTLRDRPLRGGMSISTADNDYGGTGTLGICVTLNDGNTYALSNNHAIAGTNRAPLGLPILQPGEGDGGAAPDDVIGFLSRFVPLDFGTTWVLTVPGAPPIELPNPNFVDAALARIIDVAFTAPQRIADGYNVGNRELHWIGYPRQLVAGRWSVEQKTLLLGLRVCKMGRTTGFTTGTILSAFHDRLISYGSNNAWFEDQLLILGDSGPFTTFGDSGSLVVTLETGQPQSAAFPPVLRGTDPVGLVFAGAGIADNTTIANPLDAVLEELDIPQL